MAAASYFSGASMEEDQSDLGVVWKQALIDYATESGTDLMKIDPSRMNIGVILAEQDRQVLLFSQFRHNKGKVDKLRSLVSSNASIIQSVAGHVANAASSAFPPSAVILTAFNYVMNASKAVSEDYDMIVSFFDINHSFLERVSMLEGRMPDMWQFQKFLTNVFSSLLKLCGIARKYREKGRLSKWAKALVEANDPKLKGAYDTLHMHLERFESATMIATLKQTMDLGKKTDAFGKDIKAIQAGVDQTISLGQQNLAMGQQSYMLSLETKGYSKEAAAASQEILTIVGRQEDLGSEANARLKKIEQHFERSRRDQNNAKTRDLHMDAGARKSTALKRLSEMLSCESIDTQAQLQDLEYAYVNGTCLWFQQEEAYNEFQYGNTPLLWLTGPAGNGKSTMMSTLQAALRQEFISDSSTSVAHFFWREDMDGFRNEVDMLRSCAIQIAEQDVVYREELLADLLRNLRRDPLEPKNYWERLFVSRFGKSSNRRAILVLDGLDEATRESAITILGYFNQIVKSDGAINITVVFSTDDTFDSGEDSLKATKFELTKENANVKKDMKTIAMARMKQLSRLKRLRPAAKKTIALKLRKKADTIRYIEHMLRKLNGIGREGPIMKELERLPKDTVHLYEMLLEDCQKSRTDEDLAVLRKFFAWVAYAKEPLSVASATSLLDHIAKDHSISIDEEIEHRSARLLRLSNASFERDQDTDASEADTEPDDDDKSEKDEDTDRADDVGVFLGFQERSLRQFFRQNDPGEKGLRSGPAYGNLMLFEAISSILTAEKSGDEAFTEGSQLTGYAARHWLEHLLEIRSEDLNNEQAACLVECLYGILSNRNHSIRVLEEQGSWHEPSNIFGASDENRDKALACLKDWATRATRLGSSGLSTSTIEWMRPLIRTPQIIYIKTAESHVANWFFNPDLDYYARQSFGHAHRALELGKDLVQQNVELRKYFENGAPQTFDDFTEESVLVVSKAFWQMQMTMTAQSYRAIGMAMKSINKHEASLKQFELGLEVADTEEDKVHLYAEICEATLSLASEAAAEEEEEEAKQKARRQSKSNGAAEERSSPEEIVKVPESAESTAAGNEKTGEQEEPKLSPKERKLKWAKLGVEAHKKSSEIKVSYSDVRVKDMYLKTSLVQLANTRVEMDLIMGVTDNVVELYRKAKEIPTTYDGTDIAAGTARLAQMQDWAKLIEVVGLLDKSTRWRIVWASPKSLNGLFRAAKELNNLKIVHDIFQDTVRFITGLDGGSTTTYAQLIPNVLEHWANFNRTVVGGAEGYATAKALYHQMIEVALQSQFFSTASFRLADILIEEFRTTTNPKKKLQAHSELNAVVARMQENMGNEFDPTQSQTTIPLALMNRKLAAVEFERGLKATFDGCMAALTDTNSWNDSVSFCTLAKALACLPGLHHEAEIAASCQLYIIDVELYTKENESGAGVDADKDAEVTKTAEDKPDGETSSDNQVPASEPTTNGTAAEPPNGTSEAVVNGTGTADHAAEAKVPATETNDEDKGEKAGDDTPGDKVESDEDLDPINGNVGCANCEKIVSNWKDDAMYLCYYCTETCLCESCYNNKLAREKGDMSPDWRTLCPAGHKHIRAPVAGWKGVKDGVLRFEDHEVKFSDWLLELKEKKWVEAWEKYWSDENDS